MYSRLTQQLLENVLKPKQGSIDVSALHDYDAEWDKIETFPARALLTTAAYPPLKNVVLRSAAASTYLGTARVAIAVEHYRTKNSSLPENLDELVPEFIAKIPHDLIDGKPLRYQKISTTNYRIWSIGSDRKDGGGAPGPDTTRATGYWKATGYG
jgi:hypothetical protein